MDKEELLEQFEKNVVYLRKNIPPDDIYIFTEQTFMAARFFLMKWCDHVKIQDEMEADRAVDAWVKNILYFCYARDNGIDINLDMDIFNDRA